MKKSWKKMMSLLLGMSMAGSLLAGCGSSNATSTSTSKSADATEEVTESAAEGDSGESAQEEAIDISEHVDLTLYLIGDRTADFDEVYAKINEILEEKLNCSLSVEFLSWGEHSTKYSLLFSAKEDFDLIYTAGWCHYLETVNLGGFMPLSEEFIQTYAPDIWEVVPEAAWSDARVNGEIYMVPNYATDYQQDVIAVRGDLMEKYGIAQITNYDELVEFYKACAKEGIYACQSAPWYLYFGSKGMALTSGTPQNGELILTNRNDPQDTNFYYILDWDGFEEYCKQAKELADAGCWSSDILNSNDERQTGLLTGRVATMQWTIGSCKTYAEQANAENPDWNVTICDPQADMEKSVGAYTSNGVAININSNNPERAMMVLNEFYTNPEVYDLAMLGIEGKHWEAIGDDQYKVIDESGYGVDNNCNWGWKNDNLTREEYIEERTELDDVYEGMMQAWSENIFDKSSWVYNGFKFDSTNVTTQVAAVEANVATYYTPLINGLVDDVDKAIEDFRKAMETAGIQDILDELNEQAAAFVAENQ